MNSPECSLLTIACGHGFCDSLRSVYTIHASHHNRTQYSNNDVHFSSYPFTCIRTHFILSSTLHAASILFSFTTTTVLYLGIQGCEVKHIWSLLPYFIYWPLTCISIWYKINVTNTDMLLICFVVHKCIKHDTDYQYQMALFSFVLLLGNYLQVCMCNCA